MLAAVVYADFDPRPDYKITEAEKKTRKVVSGSRVWRNPRLVLEDRPVPELGPDEVLIRVGAVGICGSDIHFLETDEDGYILYPGLTRFPVVIGHEFAGVVEKVGSNVRWIKPGDLVTAEEMWWCGVCDACRSGFLNHCYLLNDPSDMEYGELGFTHDGAMAEYVKVRERYVWKIDRLVERYGSEEKALEAGSLVEPTSVAYNGIFVRGGGFKPGSYVVVWGAGPIGLAATALAKAAGAGMVITFDIRDPRLAIAREVGADYTFNSLELEKRGIQPWEKIMELTGGKGADMHVEAAGAPHVIWPQAEKSLAINGKYVQIGRADRTAPVFLEVLQVRRSQIFGAQGHSGWGTFPNVIRMMAGGRIDMTKIITSRFRLSDVEKAFEKAFKREDAKITIKP